MAPASAYAYLLNYMYVKAVTKSIKATHFICIYYFSIKIKDEVTRLLTIMSFESVPSKKVNRVYHMYISWTSLNQ